MPSPAQDARMSDDLQLNVVSSARVALQLRRAGLGNRALAYVIDLAIVGGLWLAIAVIVTTFFAQLLGRLVDLSSLSQALLTVAAFVLTSAYDIFFETFYDGQSPGKRLLGLRVVRLDGGRLGFFDAALRNLLRVVDILPMAYGVGIVSMAVDPQQRRLGDLVAGCAVLREAPSPEIPLHSLIKDLPFDPAFATAMQSKHLTPPQRLLVERFFRRRHELLNGLRQQIALRLLDGLTGPYPDQAWELADPERVEGLLAVLLRAQMDEPHLSDQA